MKPKSASLAKAILAALRYGKTNSVKEIADHPYIKILERHKISFKTALFRLNKAGLIKIENNNISLTQLGEQRSIHALVDTETSIYKTDFFQKWDGAWRILLFDIPENKRGYRDFLRKTLKRLGFKELQRSIWIYPYPVPQFLKELVFHGDVVKHARLITTDSLEDDSDLKKIFSI